MEDDFMKVDDWAVDPDTVVAYYKEMLETKPPYHLNFNVLSILHPEKVIFNNPATIVFWDDGSKTVVKAQPGEIFDKEKGLAMAFAKKASGNKGHYNEVFKKFGAVEHSEQGQWIHWIEWIRWIERSQDGDPTKDGTYLVTLSCRKDVITMNYSVREGWRDSHFSGNMDDMVVAWAEMPPKFMKM